jgi:hypothetical protein
MDVVVSASRERERGSERQTEECPIRGGGERIKARVGAERVVCVVDAALSAVILFSE